MILAGNLQSLEIDLTGAVAANQCVFYVEYHDDKPGGTIAGKTAHGTTNNTTNVTLVAAPAVNEVRRIDYLSVYNADTGPLTIQVLLNDNATTRIIVSFVLATLERLEYVRGAGFRCFTTAGAVK